jgi:hypothetical protein
MKTTPPPRTGGTMTKITTHRAVEARYVTALTVASAMRGAVHDLSTSASPVDPYTLQVTVTRRADGTAEIHAAATVTLA